IPSDGILSVLCSASNEGSTVRNPKNQIKIDAKNVVGLSDGTQFNGFDGVAFGTSLTYNSLTGNGYLTRLGILSGISFDNQGVGSSTILGNGSSLDMLAKIKAYTSFSDKRVCLLEGFVNDWYGQNPLGTWQDTEETTVCGCVRSALTYMLTQNANMTVFLILDHYGRSYSSLDCSSTVTRNGLTQFEYYSEIEKVAKSLGIPVIREFELSGISELMPQYLADNIHLNALGAIQSGNVIWNEMKLHPVNES
ncbi:MAG: SGNH/GDSL hydrolase family protein, partial [Lachnospiraceae bacterium]|nr:SGNH/GDSL hydrolase family protein [Lachnospiraceae bacterium]